MSNHLDNELWEAFCQHDRQAFSELFKRSYPFLYRYGIKVTSNKQLLEDCIQELFIELWNQKKETPVTSVRSYLIRALKYKLMRAIKLDTKNISSDGSMDLNFEMSHENFLITRQEMDERMIRITEALQQLPGRQREIIYLKFFHGMNYEEVAHIMEINYQVARNLLYQAVKSLRKIIVTLNLIALVHHI